MADGPAVKFSTYARQYRSLMISDYQNDNVGRSVNIYSAIRLCPGNSSYGADKRLGTPDDRLTSIHHWQSLWVEAVYLKRDTLKLEYCYPVRIHILNCQLWLWRHNLQVDSSERSHDRYRKAPANPACLKSTDKSLYERTLDALQHLHTIVPSPLVARKEEPP